MINIMKKKKIVCVVVGLSLVLSGCSTINPYTGEKQMSDTTLGTGIGALGGAAIGAIAGGGRALIGGLRVL